MPIEGNNQTVGNAGLFFVCHQLSKLGWNVLPTSRNAKGIDIIAYGSDASESVGIQVKALTKRNPVPLGTDPENLIADFLVVCQLATSDKPVCYVLRTDEIRAHKGTNKEGKISYWLQMKEYEQETFKDNWDRIGKGNKA